jgi:hypothetical protein
MTRFDYFRDPGHRVLALAREPLARHYDYGSSAGAPRLGVPDSAFT